MRLATALRKSLLHSQRSVGKYCRYVSSQAAVSPLATEFNTKRSKKFSIFKRANKSVGLFSIPELKDPSGYKVIERRCVEEVESLIAESCDPARTRKLVVIMDEMSDCICRVADLCEFLRLTHPDMKNRNAAEETLMRLVEIVERLNTNVEVHDALQAVIDKGDVVETTETDRRVAELFMADHKQSGIHLDDSKRGKFVDINNTVTRITNNFMNMCQEPTPKMDFELPKDILSAFSFEGGRGFVNNLNNTTDNPTELVREGTFRIFLYPNRHQERLLGDMLEGRRIMAQLTDYESFAHRTLQGTITGTPERTMQFLESMAENVREGAQREYDHMKKEKHRFSQHINQPVRNEEIMPWDLNFFTQLAKQNLFNPETLSEYFTLGNCIDGLNNLFQNIFGISLENVTPEPGEVWDEHVYKLAVTDEKEGILGYIFCDLFERSSKTHQDCLFTIQGGKMKQSGEYQLPIVTLNLNLRNTFAFCPPMLSASNVENLFHEFGHAIHSMVGRTQYQHVTGTRCAIDFAEVPSVLMEYFASDPRVVKTFARHFQHGDAMEDQDVRNFCKSKRMYLYSDIQLQVFHSILDQIYHGRDFSPKTPTQILEETQNKYYGLPYVENTCWHLRFSHLAGYGGRYYSYLVSRAIASRIWRQLFRDDPFNRESGEIYRRKMLAFGGEKDPRILVKDLLGEEPTIEMLVESLSHDLVSRSLVPR